MGSSPPGPKLQVTLKHTRILTRPGYYGSMMYMYMYESCAVYYVYLLFKINVTHLHMNICIDTHSRYLSDSCFLLLLLDFFLVELCFFLELLFSLDLLLLLFSLCFCFSALFLFRALLSVSSSLLELSSDSLSLSDSFSSLDDSSDSLGEDSTFIFFFFATFLAAKS